MISHGWTGFCTYGPSSKNDRHVSCARSQARALREELQIVEAPAQGSQVRFSLNLAPSRDPNMICLREPHYFEPSPTATSLCSSGAIGNSQWRL